MLATRLEFVESSETLTHLAQVIEIDIEGVPSGCALSVPGCWTAAMWWPQGWRYRWTSPWNGPLGSSSGAWNLVCNYGLK